MSYSLKKPFVIRYAYAAANINVCVLSRRVARSANCSRRMHSYGSHWMITSQRLSWSWVVIVAEFLDWSLPIDDSVPSIMCQQIIHRYCMSHRLVVLTDLFQLLLKVAIETKWFFCSKFCLDLSCWMTRCFWHIEHEGVVCRAVLPSTASPGGGWGNGL